MRIWSIHPKYLDSKGLVALWRESLLAQRVLEGKTKGYKNHPQLDRFKTHKRPVFAIGFYLYHVYLEAKKRGYNFKKEKIINFDKKIEKIRLSRQLIFEEFEVLKKKLKTRDINTYRKLVKLKRFETHPLFVIS